MSGKPRARQRSGCPVAITLETLGDRWSLLIIRDLMVRGLRTFKEFRESGEGIATNVLAERLRRLESAGLLAPEPDPSDKRRSLYRLTEKGIALAPVLLEMLIWGARHVQTGAPAGLADRIERDRESVLAEVERQWRERDHRPLLPHFGLGNRKQVEDTNKET